MKTKTAVIVILILLAGALCQAGAAKTNIAVIDLVGKNVDQGEASILTDKLRGALFNTGQFQVIERAQMEAILKEQGFQQSGCTDESCIIEMGQLMGVERIVTGSVGKIGSMYLVSVRMIDVAKGKIVLNADREVGGSIENVLRTAIPDIAKQMAGGSAPKRQSVKAVKLAGPGSASKGGWGPFLASCFLGPRVGLEMNEGKPIETMEWVALALNFTVGFGWVVRGLQGSNNGCTGFTVGCCIGPRVGQQLDKRKIRGKELLFFVPVVNIVSAALISMEAMNGKTMAGIEAAENLKR